MIKNFIVSMFSKILDVVFILFAILILLSAIGMSYAVGILGFLGTLIGGAAMLVLSFGFIYILLDIRDLLKTLVEANVPLNQNKNSDAHFDNYK